LVSTSTSLSKSGPIPGWLTVATADSPNLNESIRYTGPPGEYRYRVVAASGSSVYLLGYWDTGILGYTVLRQSTGLRSIPADRRIDDKAPQPVDFKPGQQESAVILPGMVK
jgi:hypothetical protein